MKKHGETRSNHLTTEQKTLELRREEEIEEAALEQHQESFVDGDNLSHSEDEDSEPPMLYPFDFPEEVLQQQLHEAQAAEAAWREKYFQRCASLEEQEQLQHEASKATLYWDARADRYNRILQNIGELESTTEERTKLQTIVTACQQAAEAATVDLTQQLPHFDFTVAKLFNDLFKREVADKAKQGGENLLSSSAQTPTTAKQKILTSTSNFNFCKTTRLTKALVKYLACSAGLSMLPKVHAASTTLSTGLVGYYPFNGTAYDFSGNGNHGTPHSITPAADRFGNINNAYSFDGSSSYVELTNGEPFNFVNQFSVSAWVKPASSQASGAVIFSKPSSNGGWLIDQPNVTNELRFGDMGTHNSGAPCSMPLLSNVWNHLAVTVKDLTAHCYLNNILVGTGAAPSIAANSNLPLTIGAFNTAHRQPASGLTSFFNGLLDEIRIYNRTLSASEISQLATAQKAAPQEEKSEQARRQLQSAIGSEFQISTLTTEDYGNYYPSVTSLSGGGFVVTWPAGGNPYKIYGRRYDSSGVAIGSSEFQISTLGVRNNKPSVSSLSGGGFVVTWSGGDPYKIYGRRYDSSGVAIGTQEFQISTLTTGHAVNPSVTSLSGGGFVVTWSGGDPEKIYGRRYDSSGVAIGTQEFQISTLTTGDAVKPSVSSLSGGGFVVTWSQFGDIYGRRYDSSGVAIGSSQFQISTNTGYSIAPSVSVTSLSGGGFVVTWSRGVFTYNIYGRRYDSNGVAIGSSEFQINMNTGSYFYPSVTGLPGGNYIVTWDVRSSGSSLSAILGRLFSSNSSSTEQLSSQPTKQPSTQPTLQPTKQPSRQPSRQPSGQPTSKPTTQPSYWPMAIPSLQPSDQLSFQPTQQPIAQPSHQPNSQPSLQPTEQPSLQSTDEPTSQLSDSSSDDSSQKRSAYIIAAASVGGVFGTGALIWALHKSAVLDGAKARFINKFFPNRGKVVPVEAVIEEESGDVELFGGTATNPDSQILSNF